jgi:hypothetical protein
MGKMLSPSRFVSRMVHTPTLETISCGEIVTLDTAGSVPSPLQGTFWV